MYFSVFVIASLLTSGIHSFSVVNNVTVSRDFLQELFYKQIRNNQHSSGIRKSASYDYDDQKCLLSLQEINDRNPDREVAPFLDAWGHYPSGVLYGNNYDVGNYEQCVTISVTLTNVTGAVNGQFCFAKIPLKTETSSARLSYDTVVRDINIGICVPDTCSPEYLELVFKQLVADNVELAEALADMTIGQCTNGKTPPFSTINIVAISIFGVFTGLMVLSSLYDFLMNYYGKTPVPVLLAFSILTNGKKLFAINTKRSPNNIDCLTAIRVISMIWIINHHMFSNNFVPSINQNDLYAWINSFISMPARMATSVVDSFFFIGGLLVAWIGFRDLDKTKGKINIVMNIVHRYIRLTPVLAAGLLTIFGLYDILFTGPFRELALGQITCNGYNWWPILIYIQNYFIQDTKCYDETWYLAVDFQLYVLSPLLLIPMWKWGNKVVAVVVGLIIAASAWAMAVFFMGEFVHMTIGGNVGEWEKTYSPMHTRCAPWLIGFVLGYFMHKNRQTTFKISRIVQLLAWIASIGTFFVVILGPYSTLNTYGQATVFEAAMYEGLKRVSWALALSWITFACHYGFGGVVDAFLSHPFWQPLGRMTYALYLMHIVVIRIHFGMMRTVKYFSPYNMFLGFWSAFGVTLLIAIYMSLAFEAPILVLEKFIFGHGNKTDKKPQAVEPSKVIVEQPQKEV